MQACLNECDCVVGCVQAVSLLTKQRDLLLERRQLALQLMVATGRHPAPSTAVPVDEIPTSMS